LASKIIFLVVFGEKMAKVTPNTRERIYAGKFNNKDERMSLVRTFLPDGFVSDEFADQCGISRDSWRKIRKMSKATIKQYIVDNYANVGWKTEHAIKADIAFHFYSDNEQVLSARIIYGYFLTGRSLDADFEYGEPIPEQRANIRRYSPQPSVFETYYTQPYKPDDPDHDFAPCFLYRDRNNDLSALRACTKRSSKSSTKR
jgi:hypothetical protein